MISMKKFWVVILLLLLAVGAGAFYFRFYFVFGEGVKSGELNYVVKKGIIFKTYEGKLIQSGIRSKAAGSIQSYEFEFSVENAKLAERLMLEGGKVVEAKAERGEELLKEMVSMDAGAAMLGECALVPYTSPIRESGITFYETLFDENAACHLAMGRGFTNCVKEYDKYTLDELHDMGINESMIHVDFMIGTEDLSVVAVTESGERIAIFEHGVWAF